MKASSPEFREDFPLFTGEGSGGGGGGFGYAFDSG